MRVILPPGFSRILADELRELNFDILLTPERDLSELLRLSSKETRILFVQSELLRGPALSSQVIYGIISISRDAATVAGFRKYVIPHLRRTSEDRFRDHITCISGSDGVEVEHLTYENERIQERIAIPRGTDEQFLHYSTNGYRDLRNKGILLAGFTRTNSGYFVERHPTKFHFLGIIIQGQLDCSPNVTQGEPLKAPAMFIIPSGSHVSYQANGLTEFLWLHIHSGVFGQGLADKFPHRRGAVPQADEMIVYCRQFRSEARSHGVDRDIALTHLASLIELSIHRQVSLLGMRIAPDESRERLLRALSSIENRLSNPISVDDLAKMVGLSPSRLYRETRRCFGKSPGTLIEEIRIRHARELLLHSDYKLEKVAEMTGYADAFTFSRAFKRLSGCPPSAFRKGGV